MWAWQGVEGRPVPSVVLRTGHSLPQALEPMHSLACGGRLPAALNAAPCARRLPGPPASLLAPQARKEGCTAAPPGPHQVQGEGVSMLYNVSN